jgi:hypothetical protein
MLLLVFATYSCRQALPVHPDKAVTNGHAREAAA